MTPIALADTGFLLAYLDPDDQHHDWAVQQFKRYALFLTCEAVLCEVDHLTRSRLRRPGLIVPLIESGSVEIGFSLLDNEARLGELMRQYADRPMDLADACLVLMSEQMRHHELLTVDSDFLFYRRSGNATVLVNMP